MVVICYSRYRLVRYRIRREIGYNAICLYVCVSVENCLEREIAFSADFFQSQVPRTKRYPVYSMICAFDVFPLPLKQTDRKNVSYLMLQLNSRTWQDNQFCALSDMNEPTLSFLLPFSAPLIYRHSRCKS